MNDTDPTPSICPVCKCIQDKKSYYISKVQNGYTLCATVAYEIPSHLYKDGRFQVFPGSPLRVFPTLVEVMSFLAQDWSIGVDEKPPCEGPPPPTPQTKPKRAEKRGLTPEDAAAREQYLIDLVIELWMQHFGL